MQLGLKPVKPHSKTIKNHSVKPPFHRHAFHRINALSIDFKELDYQKTPLGDISLRRRSEPRLDDRVLYEVKLGDEFLMSSLFTEAERQLTHLALAELNGDELQVVVGGLGLGYTAAAALEHSAVTSLIVIDVMAPVIDWHRRGLVPLGKTLTDDPRCQLIEADFFAVSTNPDIGFDGSAKNSRVHAVLVDIDHSPSRWLNPGNGTFYTAVGLSSIARKLLPGGVFGLWSDDPDDDRFMELLSSVFHTVSAHEVAFENPYTDAESTNTVYLARTPN